MYLEYQDFCLIVILENYRKKTIKSYRNTTLLFLKYVEKEFQISKLREIKPIHIR